MNVTIEIRKLAHTDIPECRRILYSLPDWFGIEEANRAYIESLQTLPGAVVRVGDAIVGFIALTEHTPQSIEIHVIAVEQEYHRRGVGRKMIKWCEDWCRSRDIPWLHVKTRGPSTPDPQYERTRQFYISCGFESLFESLTLWGPQNAALILVKHLSCHPYGA